MPRSKVVDRPPVEVLLDNGRADVRRARDGRSVAQALAYVAHHGRDGALRFGLGSRDSPLRERDRGGQSSAPRAEILGREFLAEELANVLVQARAVEVDALA